MAKILYLSCHSILEQEEVLLLHELGHEIFSPGAYVEPRNPGDSSLRPGIPGLVYSAEVLEAWHKVASTHPGEDGKDYLTREFVDLFDVVCIMHLPRWIERNWEAMKHKRVIWRTIGQSVASTENQLRRYRSAGMEIVRYSPREDRIPGMIGSDALIRFYKDPEIYDGWNGQTEHVVTFAQDMLNRNQACNFDLFELATRPFPRKLFGSNSEKVGSWGMGKVPFEQLKKEMRDARCYFYTGTHPASYTLNGIEAMLTGVPLVCIGPKYGNASYFPGHELYEMPDLIINGHNGFISDSVSELQGYIVDLLNDYDMAKAISAAGRRTAIQHFGKDMIRNSWRNYLAD